MPKVRLDIAYDGSGFRGYARQKGLRTVQGELEAALEKLVAAPVSTAVAGRTDAGVHARGQVVSYETAVEPDVDRTMRSLNGLLGPEIAVKAVRVAPEGFDARFSALWRRYRYLLSAGGVGDPTTRGHVWNTGRALDVEAMRKVVALYIGEHDFSAFCRNAAGRTNVRRVEESVLEADRDAISYWVRANAFCHQMVRSLVGLAFDVGRGYIPVAEVAEIIEGRDRGRVKTVAPPHGLSLWEVGYPPD
jgi:tRNA pseudouridine38-40 synthase